MLLWLGSWTSMLSQLLHINFVEALFGVMVTVLKFGTATRGQILDDSVSILHNANTLGKGMTPIIVPPTMVK